MNDLLTTAKGLSIRISGLTKMYSGRKFGFIPTVFKKTRSTHTVFKNISLKLESGSLNILTGKSGCGKTTLLNIIGLIDVDYCEGKVEIDEVPYAPNGSGSIRAAKRLEHIGHVFQDYQLVEELSVLRNVELPLRLLGRNSRNELYRAKKLLSDLGITPELGHEKDLKYVYPAELSGGQKQRVAIARALVNKPRLIIADEPTGNLDNTTTQNVMQVLMDQCRTMGSTLLMVTHDVKLHHKAEVLWDFEKFADTPARLTRRPSTGMTLPPQKRITTSTTFADLPGIRGHGSIGYDGAIVMTGGINQDGIIEENGFSKCSIENNPIRQEVLEVRVVGSAAGRDRQLMRLKRRSHHQILRFKDRLWIIGGNDGINDLNDIWESGDAITWKEAGGDKQKNWPGRSSFVALEHLDKIWILGGKSYNHLLNDVWNSSDGNTWNEVKHNAPWMGRLGHQGVAFKGKIWIVGGWSEDGRMNDIWSSNDGDGWKREGTLPVDGLNHFQLINCDDNYLLILGGSSGKFTITNDAWKSFDGIQWKRVKFDWIPRSDFQAVYYRKSIYVLGGWNGSHCLDDCFILTLSGIPVCDNHDGN